MKKINIVLTALGNPSICKELEKNNIRTIAQDIQYKEGILEFLENNSRINYVIIDEKLPGNLKIEELVYSIKKINKKIKIIIISEKELKIHVFRILRSINTKDIVSIINNQNVFNKPYIPIEEALDIKKRKGEVLTILGTNGIGKSIFSLVFAKQNKGQKVLIIDFDLFNNDLHTLMGVKEYSKKVQTKLSQNEFFKNPIDIHDFIIQTKLEIDLLSGINLIFNSNQQASPSKIRNIIKKVKAEYDLIIIDTNSECLLEYTKELIRLSDSSIFISGANLLEIKKSKRILEIYNKEWGVSKNRINVIFNKCTKKSVDDSVLKRVFRNYNILGKIKLSDYYDLVINNNNTLLSKIEKEVLNINKKYKISKNRKLRINKIKK